MPDEVEVVKVICTLHFRHVVPGPDDGVLRHTRSAGDGTCGSEWFIVRTDRVTDRAKAMVTAREHPVQAA